MNAAIIQRGSNPTSANHGVHKFAGRPLPFGGGWLLWQLTT